MDTECEFCVPDNHDISQALLAPHPRREGGALYLSVLHPGQGRSHVYVRLCAGDGEVLIDLNTCKEAVKEICPKVRVQDLIRGGPDPSPLVDIFLI